MYNILFTGRYNDDGVKLFRISNAMTGVTDFEDLTYQDAKALCENPVDRDVFHYPGFCGLCQHLHGDAGYCNE